MSIAAVICEIKLQGGYAENGLYGSDEAERLYKCGADGILINNTDATQAGVAAACRVVAESAGRVFVPIGFCGTVYETAQIKVLIGDGIDKVFYNTGALRNAWRIDDSAEKVGGRYVGLSIECAPMHGFPDNREVLIQSHVRRTGKDACLWAIEGQNRGATMIAAMFADENGCCDVCDERGVKLLRDAVSLPLMVRSSFTDGRQFAAAFRAGATTVASDALKGEDIKEIKKYLADEGLQVRI